MVDLDQQKCIGAGVEYAQSNHATRCNVLEFRVLALEKVFDTFPEFRSDYFYQREHTEAEAGFNSPYTVNPAVRGPPLNSPYRALHARVRHRGRQYFPHHLRRL